MLPCLGGFTVTERYGNLRTTPDFGVLDIAPKNMSSILLAKAQGACFCIPVGYKLMHFYKLACGQCSSHHRLSPAPIGIVRDLHAVELENFRSSSHRLVSWGPVEWLEHHVRVDHVDLQRMITPLGDVSERVRS